MFKFQGSAVLFPTLPAMNSAVNFSSRASTYKKINFSTVAGIFLAVLNFFVFFSFLRSVNSNASSGYEIKKMQAYLNTVTEDNRKLNVMLAEKDSFAAVQENFREKKFISAGTPNYIEVGSFSFDFSNNSN